MMRLPLVPALDSRDGLANKDSRLTNVLKESGENGDKAVIRPGLVLQAEGTGVGGGLVAFNNELVSLFGTDVHGNPIAGTNPLNVEIADLDFRYQEEVVFDGNHTYVCTGDLRDWDVIYTSDDGGETWAAYSLPSLATWCRAAWDGSKFIVIAYNSNKAATSPDGKVWTAQTLPSSSRWINIKWSGSVFCIIAFNSNVCATSATGLTGSWTSGTLPSTSFWNAMTWNGSVFCTVASSTTKAAYSANGLAWTAATLPSSQTWDCIAWNGAMFVVLSGATLTKKVATSPTGATWSAAADMPIDANWFAIAANGSRVVAVPRIAGYDIYESTDMVTWSIFTGTTLDADHSAIFVMFNGTKFCFLVTDQNYPYPVNFVTEGSDPSVGPVIGTITSGYYDFAQSPI